MLDTVRRCVTSRCSLFSKAALVASLLLTGCGGQSPNVPDSPAAPAPEFRVTTTAEEGQVGAAVAVAPSGAVVMAWATIDPLSVQAAQETVRVRRFSAGLQPLGAELLVRPPSHSHITGIRLGMVADGSFVVLWGQDEGQFARRYDAAGAPLTQTFRVSDDGRIGDLAITDPSGGFMALWTEQVASVPGDADIMGQRFSGAGAPLGEPFRVNALRAGGNYNPRLLLRGDGSLLVVWNGLLAQFLSRTGERIGSQLSLSPDPTRRNVLDALLSQPGGGFVVVWNTAPADSFNYSVAFRRFDPAGAALGPATTVFTNTSNIGLGGVAAAGRDDFIVIWSGGDEPSPVAQRYSAAGAPQGARFAISTVATGPEFGPSVAAEASGSFVVAWSKTPNGSLSSTLWARRLTR